MPRLVVSHRHERAFVLHASPLPSCQRQSSFFAPRPSARPFTLHAAGDEESSCENADMLNTVDGHERHHVELIILQPGLLPVRS